MKLFANILILLLLSTNIFGQQIKMLTQGIDSDSSFYHLEKINANEFWAGGEYGILKKIDSLGNMSSLNFPNEGLDILKIKRIQNNIFILTSNAVIYRFDIEKNIFFKKEFSKFRNRCFYDLIVLNNGKLLVCGGATGIAKAEKKIPNGFIATVDEDLNEINVVWRSKRKFVWSLATLENQNILAATFNGLNTQIIKSENFKSWKKEINIKGLVHEIALFNKQIWYCGSKNIHYTKDGILGQASKGQKQKKIIKTGCLWSLDTLDGEIIAVTQSGELLKLDKTSNEIEAIKTPKTFTVYDIEKISESKLLVVGHGKTAYIIDFKQY